MRHDFGETEKVAITVLVDNVADLIVKSSATVKYYTAKPLLAEHGFAALLELKAAGLRILWDAGMTQLTLLENMRRMGLDPATIDIIALSHGHSDHTAAVADILRAISARRGPKRWAPATPPEEIENWLQRRRVPLVVHPAAFRERWDIEKSGAKVGPELPPSRAEWEAAGAKVILAEGPHELGPGCWTTGAVPRLSFEKSGRRANLFYRQGGAFAHDDLDEDQAIAINVKGKGLVVLSGCAHAGIVNTVQHARQISGVERVWAVLGGFHLARASDEEIERTIAEVQSWRPVLIAPTHCTGFWALCRFAAAMPKEFVRGVVGAQYLF